MSGKKCEICEEREGEFSIVQNFYGCMDANGTHETIVLKYLCKDCLKEGVNWIWNNIDFEKSGSND